MSAYPSSWRRLVADAIANGATCVDCGTDRNLEGDHELPVSRGGLSTRANLAIRCRRCNRRKGNRVTRYQLRVPWPPGAGGGSTGRRSDPPPEPTATYTFKTGTYAVARYDAPTKRVTFSRGNLGRGGRRLTDSRAASAPGGVARETSTNRAVSDHAETRRLRQTASAVGLGGARSTESRVDPSPLPEVVR
jgi:hypothetical protein